MSETQMYKTTKPYNLCSTAYLSPIDALVSAGAASVVRNTSKLPGFRSLSHASYPARPAPCC
jgi:hypothetical protein